MEKTLGKNATIFERHVIAGLDLAGLEVNDYSPGYLTDRETGEIGFCIQQLSKEKDPDSETMVVCFEDRLVWFAHDNGSELVIRNDQPASLVAVLVLAAIWTADPMYPPRCQECQEEGYDPQKTH
jgi:hypothetical protein